MVSRHATAIHVSLFDASGATELYRFTLPHRLGDVHYGFIHGAAAGARYGLRADGPWDPAQGHRFDAAKLLVDPYATALDRPFTHHADLMIRGVDTAHLVPKCIVEDISPPPCGEGSGVGVTRDSTRGPPPSVPPHRGGGGQPRFIYELQVKAFTKLHPGVPEAKRGTVAALAEPAVIDHLLKLGVDMVELMPLAAWIDERHLPPLGLHNAWGYNPVCFMAPDPRLAPGGLAEIRDTVSALHRAGIGVILDVVFNHTGESDEAGATLSLRGLDNALYYRHADGRLVNDTGCGNTLALARAPVMQLAMDAMRSWILRTGIDGFRFDLAPVMGRTAQGFEAEAPLLAAIEQDPLLSRAVMIAEPWDIGPGGYRLGGFPARWGEWNDRYRDDVRRFWNGQLDAGQFATRIAGSSDLFAPLRRPSCSINYVAAHDGFTLRDLVTSPDKNNHANGEGNRDGNGHEPVWRGGDVKALLATLLLSRGTPMLTAGDEFGRSQGGNNNAYAQDNETTWLDWARADHDLIATVAKLAQLRKVLPLISAPQFLSGVIDEDTGFPDALWLKPDGSVMDWQDPAEPVVGLVLAGNGPRLALWLNRGPAIREPRLPRRAGYRWSRLFCSAEGSGLPAASVALHAEEPVRQQGIADVELHRLAAAAGIERDWWEVDGTHHDVSPETLRAVLAALGVDHASPADAEDSLLRLRRRRKPLLGFAGSPTVLGPAAPHRRRYRVTGEGSDIAVDVAPGALPQADLPPGYYAARSEDEPGVLRHVIVSPGPCYMPDDIAGGARVFGLASHLYALRHQGDGGIGSLETLRRFADITAAAGGRYAGLNPLHHLFPTDRERASPYQPSDRRYIDPIYIDIAQLLEQTPSPQAKAAAKDKRGAFAALEGLAAVDYAAVWQAKSAVLEAAFKDFKDSTAFDVFVQAGGDDLRRHGIFEAERAGEAAADSRIAYRAFLQWIAETQLKAAARHGSLYRDLALGSAFDGGEITEEPERFAHGVSIGVPPDPFSQAGQVWNLPPFSPLVLDDMAYAPMRTILAANMRHAAALRIDHILGFARQFWVPRGAEGRVGAYVTFPADALIAVTAIESHRQRCMVIGEDLGTIPDGLRERLAAANILSYRVLWFERDGLGFKPPSAYPPLALACLASHDLPTFRGWRAGRDIAIEQDLGHIDAATAAARRAARTEEMSLLDQAMGRGSPLADDAAAAVHGFLASAPSRVMLIQADDLAGETEPLNVPGTDRERPNWRRRLSVAVDDLAATPLAASIIARVKAERPA